MLAVHWQVDRLHAAGADSTAPCVHVAARAGDVPHTGARVRQRSAATEVEVRFPRWHGPVPCDVLWAAQLMSAPFTTLALPAPGAKGCVPRAAATT